MRLICLFHGFTAFTHNLALILINYIKVSDTCLNTTIFYSNIIFQELGRVFPSKYLMSEATSFKASRNGIRQLT